MAHPIENLIANVTDVAALFELHVKHTGTKRGRRHGVEVLNRSALVLTNACWEAFVEDVVQSGADFLRRKLISADVLPESIRRRICAQLKDQKHELAIWAIAGKGWRRTFGNYVRDHADRFNTPRASNVDELVDRCLGLKNVSSAWSWKRTTVADARAKLDEMVTLRGAIAHRVSAGASVHKKDALFYAEFIQRLAVKTSNAVRKHVKVLTGKYPWSETSIRRPELEELANKPLEQAGAEAAPLKGGSPAGL